MRADGDHLLPLFFILGLCAGTDHHGLKKHIAICARIRVESSHTMFAHSIGVVTHSPEHGIWSKEAQFVDRQESQLLNPWSASSLHDEKTSNQNYLQAVTLSFKLSNLVLHLFDMVHSS